MAAKPAIVRSVATAIKLALFASTTFGLTQTGAGVGAGVGGAGVGAGVGGAGVGAGVGGAGVGAGVGGAGVGAGVSTVAVSVTVADTVSPPTSTDTETVPALIALFMFAPAAFTSTLAPSLKMSIALIGPFVAR